MKHLYVFGAFLLCAIFSTNQIFSQELHTHSNAASIANESNALNGWTSGNISGVVESNEVFLGNYSIKFEAPDDGWYSGNYEFTATQGESYLITISGMSTSTENPEINIRGDVVNQRYARLSNSWQTFTIPVTASGTSISIRIYTGLPSLQGNTAYVDALSITPISGADTQAPTTPTLSAVGNTDTTANLTFSGATDNVGVIGHMIYKNGDYLSNTDGTGTFQVKGLTANTNYNFVVKAVDAGGNESADSNEISVTTNSGPDTQSPSAPTLSSTGHTETTVNLSWNGATDDTGVTGYIVYQDNVVLSNNVTSTTYQVTGLTAATSYDFKVKAYDAASNQSADSNVISVTTDSSSGGGGGSTSSVWTESGSTASYTGEVAIGISSVPNGYKLAVDGNIRTREIRVDQDTWPDYVFEEGYDLPSLEEIQKHIKEKGHLPNIPSAKEVETNGVELGEMNKLLLEKIEELMLFTIQQQNLLIFQQSQIHELQKEVQLLRK